MSAPAPNESLVGIRVFGGYTVTRLLGEGGMGAVYQAENPELQKSIAVKVLHPRWTHSQSITERFLAEARAASALDHPNIIDVIDSSTLDDGRYYIALEFLNGKTVGEYCKERGGSIPFDQILRILGQTCCGLAAAHYRGIVHRDLKPANLFVSPTELNPLFTKVLDFGIAKLNDPALAGDVETGTNAIAGTPAYMAPEQARGMRDVDHRADIYSLGVIAYRMVTGRLPYPADSLGELVYQQAMSQPPPPETLRPDLPESWSRLIKRSMLLAPHQRPSGTDEFAILLARGLPDGTAILRDVAPHFFTPNWISRTRKVSGAAVAEALANTSPAASAPPVTTSTAVEKPVAAPQLETLSYDDPSTPGPTPKLPEPVPSRLPNTSSRSLLLVVAGIVALLAVLAIAWLGGDPNESATATPDAAMPDSLPLDAGASPIELVDAAGANPVQLVDAAVHGTSVDAAVAEPDAARPKLKPRRRQPREGERAKERPRNSDKDFDPDAPLGGT